MEKITFHQIHLITIFLHPKQIKVMNDKNRHLNKIINKIKNNKTD